METPQNCVNNMTNDGRHGRHTKRQYSGVGNVSLAPSFELLTPQPVIASHVATLQSGSTPLSADEQSVVAISHIPSLHIPEEHSSLSPQGPSALTVPHEPAQRQVA